MLVQWQWQWKGYYLNPLWKALFNSHLSLVTSQMTRICLNQPAITCSKLTIETLEQGVKYVQS